MLQTNNSYYIILLYIPYYIYRKNKSKKGKEEREDQGKGYRRHLRPFLASLLLRLMSSPSTPSPAAHLFATIAPATRTRGRAAASSASGRSHRHTSPPIDSDQQRQGSASGPSSSPLSGGESRAISSSSPRRPSPPCRGCRPHSS